MKLFLIATLLILTSCAGIDIVYEYPDGTKISYSYYRAGDQQLEDFYLMKDGNKIDIGLGSQLAKNDEISELLRLMQQTLMRIPIVP